VARHIYFREASGSLVRTSPLPTSGLREEKRRRMTDTLNFLMGLPDGATPFPWQQKLFDGLCRGEIPEALDIPTGLGKTSVMAAWLAALSSGAALPRRLIYVVDRRAVVDQATAVAEQLRERCAANPELATKLGLQPLDHSLPISTLRGRHIDNREWLAYPHLPAIVTGTVDMIGSRLLFQGYRTSRRMRPIHAALLAVDSLIVLDEAHLAPTFEALLAQIVERTARDWPAPMRTISLSATGAQRVGALGLSDADLANCTVKERMECTKRVEVIDLELGGTLAAELAQTAFAFCKDSPRRCLVFADRRIDAQTALEEFRRLAEQAELEADTELFVGARRGLEREASALRLKELGFLDDPSPLERAAVVFATSAAEVGVDMDAEVLVGDVVAWERIVQRLGRVNRRGKLNGEVRLLFEEADEKTRAARAKAPEKRNETERDRVTRFDRKRAARELASLLPDDSHGTKSANPAALLSLRDRCEKELHLRTLLRTATTPAPAYPELTTATLEDWAMTTLPDHPARPEVTPWLRGWIDEEPNTTVVWRSELPAVGLEEVLTATPQHSLEQLETRTATVVTWLGKLLARARKKSPPDLSLDDTAVVSMDQSREIVSSWSVLEAAVLKKDQLHRAIANRTVIVHGALGGLADGLLDAKSKSPAPTLEDGVPDTDGPLIPWRLTRTRSASPTADAGWHERVRVPARQGDDGEVVEWLVVDKWRDDSALEHDRSSGPEQFLDEHHAWTADRARRIVDGLKLRQELGGAVVLAAAKHDAGKAARAWQLAFSAPSDGVYAKTRGPLMVKRLEGYRHELGSLLRLPDARADNPDIPGELWELVCHLVASHHGAARPTIRTEGCEDLPPSALDATARQVADRFVELQSRWGPWGLAYLETLVRAADMWASRDNEQREAVQ
jgi:CRISPR-associated endonuclease/helicase Cas3